MLARLLVVLLALGAALVYPQAREALSTVTGYIAKRECGARHLQGRGDAHQERFAWWARMLPVKLEVTPRYVGASLLGVSRRATFSLAHGCVLDGPPLRACSSAGDAVLLGAQEGEQVRTLPALQARLALEHSARFSNNGSTGMRAIVVLHQGRVVGETHAAPFGPSSLHPGWSMTKSVLASLVGVRRLALDTPLLEGKNITLEHALNMASGLDWEERYVPGGDPTHMLFVERDVVAFAGARDVVKRPGTYWRYSSGETNLVGDLLRRSFDSECDYVHFVRSTLKEMGAPSMFIEPDANGNLVYSSFGWATARDWARFGHFHISKRAATLLRDERFRRPPLFGPSATTGKKRDYGMHWWLGGNTSYPELPEGTFMAMGFEYQFVAVIPKHNLVVAHLACAKGDDYAHVHAEHLQRLVGDVVRIVTDKAV